MRRFFLERRVKTDSETSQSIDQYMRHVWRFLRYCEELAKTNPNEERNSYYISRQIYSSFSANRDGRRRPWLRECQLFFHFFSRILWWGSCERRKRRTKKTNKKTREERGPEIFTLLGFRWHCHKRKREKTVQKQA